MALVTLLISSLLIAAASTEPAEAVQYKIINNAIETAGGIRFEREIGAGYIEQVLANASSFVWTAFAQSETERKNVGLATLIVDDTSGVAAYAMDDEIHMSANYIASYKGDVMVEITGIIYHQVTHLLQWNGNGAAPDALMEGIADYVRLKAGYASLRWVKAGVGDRWDHGYDVTARFLDYCSQFIKDGFVAELNRRMKDSYSESLFEQLLGEPVGDLWADYKEHFDEPSVRDMS